MFCDNPSPFWFGRTHAIKPHTSPENNKLFVFPYSVVLQEDWPGLCAFELHKLRYLWRSSHWHAATCHSIKLDRVGEGGGGVAHKEKKRQTDGHQTMSGCMEEKRWSVFSEAQRQIISFVPRQQGSDGSARDTLPPQPPPSRRQRARPMKGSRGQVLPMETAMTATAVLVQSAVNNSANNMSTTHLRGNLPHYGCDYF